MRGESVIDLDALKPEIEALCRRHGVRTLAVFGSQATGTARPDSDVDLVVSLEDHPRPFHRYFDLKFALEELLGREVDLVQKDAIRNPWFRKQVEQEMVEVFHA